MFPIHPPTGPFLIDLVPLGIPLQVRWYGVLIIGGAMLAAMIAARRAERRGYDPEDVWNQLLLGLVLSIAAARIYYVAFEWERYADKPLLYIINPQNGGLAIHGAIIGALVAGVVYTRYKKLPFVEWTDICLPTMLFAQSIGRWGNFFNQEAYGRPTSLPFGVTIDADRRLPPFDNMQQYPPDTLFHATFLYESIWNMAGFGLILWLERRLKGWLRTGDLALFYAIIYGAGRFWIEAFRTDSLCTNGVGGDCSGALRAAQIASLILFFGGLVGLYLNHRRALWANEMAAQGQDEPGVVQPVDAADAQDKEQSDREDENAEPLVTPAPKPVEEARG